MLGYFANVFCSTTPSLPFDLPELITPVIVADDFAVLDAIPASAEIFDTLLSLGSTKAPGPDGILALFFKEYWRIVGRDVVSMVHDFFNGGRLLAELNHTFLVLIPKVDHAQTVSQFRPISLCNVSYKIIAKLLASRLKRFLPRMISMHQSAFVPGRLIQDNSIMAHEIFHSFQSKKSKKGSMALKIDMSKAYDRMEWDLILLALKMYGFSPRWIGWIRECLSSVSYSILLNGKFLWLNYSLLWVAPR